MSKQYDEEFRAEAVKQVIDRGCLVNDVSMLLGNYPVRLKELRREYGDVQLVALYLKKELALERAQIENIGGWM